ncbi:MAG: phosphonate ABC transporter ATP-binding protein [Deltaproteobacteria bacterium]|jgi:phosphonate transport system ATP-binding protein|nr:phosphonate ABC transporter ATP-binding protein [Deltaproteobacteria bacterium]
MLKLQGLCKHFGKVKAVDQVNLTIQAGQMVGIIGRSGAGKSTLLRLINRLIDPTTGKVEFDGTDIGQLKRRALLQWRTRCAMIFQQFNLVNRLDVLTNVLVGRLGYHPTIPTLLKVFSRSEKAMAIQALDELDMAATALQRADTLSGGQQQRVAIARALVQEPKLMLADEPIASLDPHNATLVMEALKRINNEVGITVISNLHHLATARSYCERIIGMHAGRIVFDGPPSELTTEKALEVYGTEGDSDELKQALGEGPVQNEDSPFSQAAVASG